jgi:hypothetical protein
MIIRTNGLPMHSYTIVHVSVTFHYQAAAAMMHAGGV